MVIAKNVAKGCVSENGEYDKCRIEGKMVSTVVDAVDAMEAAAN